MQRFSILLLFALLFTACVEQNPASPDNVQVELDVPPTPVGTSDQTFKLMVKEAAQQPAGMPGLHSAAFGEAGGKWLFIGGRTNGFHTMFGPDRQFPQSTANDNIWVIDPVAATTASLKIPSSWALRDNLMANNMGYVQVDDLLYFVGGYGSQSDTGPSNYTYNTCIGINVPSMIAAVENGDATAAEAAISFVLEDDALRVCGGELETLHGDLYMVFGQNYPRAYDGQDGDYTESILQFRVNQGDSPTLEIVNSYTYDGEGNEFHRRDLNALHGIIDGQEAIIAWSGVFTEGQGAYLHPILITPSGSGVATRVDTSFTQKANLYKSGAVIQYDPNTKVLYTSMLGGITDYFYDEGTGEIIPSNDLPITEQLPFSTLINTIVMTPDGKYQEYMQAPPEGMPTYLGSNGQFIPLADMVFYHEIIDHSKVSQTEPTMIGWYVGGIESTGPQSGNGVVTKANDVLYEVYVEPIEN